MEDSPSRKPTSSKVIDTLHKEIDALKEELENLKVSNSTYKKKCEIVTRRNESFVDQLANAKHENDMINALLTRKERRIVDLEAEYNNVMSSNENFKMTTKNMKIRYESLQESSASSTAECERLKIAYDALAASQLEYKKHYESEVMKLNQEHKAFKQEYVTKYENLLSSFGDNDKDIDALLDGLTNKRKTLDNLYFNRNKLILDLLAKLASVSRIHGQDTKAILQDNLDNLISLRENYPDLELKINEMNQQQQPSEAGVLKEINFDQLILDSTEAVNSSFDEEATLIEEPKLWRQNTKKNNVNNKKKRYSRIEDNKLERTRTPTPPSHNHHTDKSKHKSKRKSVYGGNSNNANNANNSTNSNSGYKKDIQVTS
ncbi:mother-specific HO expression [Yamadazyma tenuis]|uniref:SWI5-dependent HO expression protein 3 n=1 Tax=Candida tenuis (strain ATCC 10573 / BCRC 21748 / CBS 615 / JCM 9827 / NBRC 10315 / NRRL Y-1498 / VKM Y-70) TaxID=590646 RepID=G3B926_CANTC|nr:uncharacterized protein CANTEDRAFT_136383 [Yamadazyma tenuis ATCC 10573]EGV62447.1 hypothetical protein CANTEDRAFT_136383 [Yamadazyma tenuis ATCC 10573]WEJ93730.1 mother-specific HO expression [Yamadazyma tenuis]